MTNVQLRRVWAAPLLTVIGMLAASCSPSEASEDSMNPRSEVSEPGARSAETPPGRTPDTSSGEQLSTQLVEIQSPRTITAGGGFLFDGDVDVSRMADYSEVAISAQLIRIGETRTTMESGGWDDLADPADLLDQRANMQILTELEIKVLDVLGSRPDMSLHPMPGETMSVYVSGGDFTFEVTPEQAEATGFRPDISDEEEQKGIDEGYEPDAPEPVPSEPFRVSMSTGYRVTLTEGDELTAFVRDRPLWDPIANDGTWLDTELIFPVHPLGHGIFVRLPDGAYRDATGDAVFTEDQLDAQAKVLATKGTAEPPVPNALDITTG